MGIVNNAAVPIINPKIPNGSAAPFEDIQSPTKNVHAKLMIARKQVIMTKQSPEMALYESMICAELVLTQPARVNTN